MTSCAPKRSRALAVVAALVTVLGACSNAASSKAGGGTTPAAPTNISEFECQNFVKIHNGGFVGIYDDGGAKPWLCFDGSKPDEWQTPVNLSFAGRPFHIADVQPQP